jgi:hypothetical protein
MTMPRTQVPGIGRYPATLIERDGEPDVTVLARGYPGGGFDTDADGRRCGPDYPPTVEILGAYDSAGTEVELSDREYDRLASLIGEEMDAAGGGDE